MAVKRYKDTSAAQTTRDGTAAAVLKSPTEKKIRDVTAKTGQTAQYFWYKDGTSEESGAHVTEVPREKFEKEPQGGNLLLRSNSVKIRIAGTVLSELSENRMSLASGKAVVKYSEDGSAFGLDDSHRIVVCKGTDEAGVRNDATLSSKDVTDFDMDTMPMAFFNATHSVKNGVKHYASSMYAFDGEGGFWAVILGKDGLLQNTGGFSIWAPGGIKKFDLDEYDTLWSWVTDHNYIFSHLSSLFAMESYELTLSSSSLAANGHVEYTSSDIIKAGYYPLAIAGFNVTRQAITVRSCYLSDCTEGQCKIHVHIRNDSNSASAGTDIKANIWVLWVKMSI